MTATMPEHERNGGLRTRQQFLEQDIRELKDDVHRLADAFQAMALQLAALGTQYATLVGLKEITERVRLLEAARNRQVGGAQWVQYGVFLLLTLLNVMLAAKGKWIP